MLSAPLPVVSNGFRFSPPAAAWLARAMALVLLLLATTGLWLTNPVRAQTALAESALPKSTLAESAAPQLTVEDIDALLETLEDDARRAAFLATLRALAAARRATAPEPGTEAETGLLANISERMREASAGIVASASVVLDAPKLAVWIADQLADPEVRVRWIDGLWRIVLVLAVGLGFEWIASWLLARPRGAVEGRESDTIFLRLPFLIARTVLDLVPIAVFATTAYGILSLVEPASATRLIALTLVNAVLVARVALALARALLVPRAPSLRVLEIANQTAAYLFVWIRRFVSLGIYGFFTLEAALLLGLPAPAHAFLMTLLALTLTVMAIAFVMQNRRPVAAWLRGAPTEAGAGAGAGAGKGAAEKGTRGARAGLANLRGRFADIWHVPAVLYLLAVFFVWALDVEGGFEFLLRATVLTALVLAVATLAALGVRRLVRRTFAISADLKETYPLLEGRANRYLPAVQAALRAVIMAIAAVAILQAWGVDSFGWLAGESGRRVVAGAVTIAIILVVALLFWEIVSAAIERYLGRLDEDTDVGGTARVRTLLPLARKAILVVLVVLVALVVLSELGINIAPLLAGAGVVGLAVGFGAQTLVKDIITGLFILIEDSVAVGDIVDVAGHTGVVEGFSVRSIRLRDLSGTVHTVPFSEVSTVRNMSKEFSYALIDAGVSYREDVDQVIAVLEEIGAMAQADPAMGPEILEPLEVMGLNELADSAVVVRVRLKTRPGKQYMVRRGFNRLMKKVFDERGIEIPFPHTTLYFGEDKEGRAPAANLRIAGAADAEAAKRAAAQAIRKPTRAAPKASGAPPDSVPDGGE